MPEKDLMRYVFVGDSWAAKGYSLDNWHLSPTDKDKRLSDYFDIEHLYIDGGAGKGNLDYIDKILSAEISLDLPILWLFTEPGRDYGRLNGTENFGWLERDTEFETRDSMMLKILQEIKRLIKNPVALIGALSDVNAIAARELGFTVLHPSWQSWMAQRIGYDKFAQGWGAPDLLWRMKTKEVVSPSKQAVYKSFEWMKFHKQAEQHGYMVMYHPTDRSNQEFAQYLKPDLLQWLKGAT
jgi:hypothetical protein